MLEIEAYTEKEIIQEFKRNNFDIKRTIIKSVLNALETKSDTAKFIRLIPQDIILSINKKDYLIALKENMSILLEDEAYEQAAKVQKWIKVLELKNK